MFTFRRVDDGLQFRKSICHARRTVTMLALFSICCFVLIWKYVLRDKHIARHEATVHINLPFEARRTSENIDNYHDHKHEALTEVCRRI